MRDGIPCYEHVDKQMSPMEYAHKYGTKGWSLYGEVVKKAAKKANAGAPPVARKYELRRARHAKHDSDGKGHPHRRGRRSRSQEGDPPSSSSSYSRSSSADATASERSPSTVSSRSRSRSRSKSRQQTGVWGKSAKAKSASGGGSSGGSLLGQGPPDPVAWRSRARGEKARNPESARTARRCSRVDEHKARLAAKAKSPAPSPGTGDPPVPALGDQGCIFCDRSNQFAWHCKHNPRLCGKCCRSQGGCPFHRLK